MASAPHNGNRRRRAANARINLARLSLGGSCRLVGLWNGIWLPLYAIRTGFNHRICWVSFNSRFLRRRRIQGTGLPVPGYLRLVQPSPEYRWAELCRKGR
jgi:hypothetical protein